MQKQKTMLATIIVMGILAMVLSIYAYNRDSLHEGLNNALKLGASVLPALIFAFIIVGMVNSLGLVNNVKSILGDDSGIKGIGVATLGGMLTPGSMFVAYPIAGTLLKSGAGIGSVVAYVVAWSTWQWLRIPFEFSFLGWKFVFVKWCCILVLPTIGGLTAKLLFSWVEF
jgi:uncharacterized membrane protein YraQ (UPF0718 family)